jgi:hypothetical protein
LIIDRAELSIDARPDDDEIGLVAANPDRGSFSILVTKRTGLDKEIVGWTDGMVAGGGLPADGRVADDSRRRIRREPATVRGNEEESKSESSKA